MIEAIVLLVLFLLWLSVTRQYRKDHYWDAATCLWVKK